MMPKYLRKMTERPVHRQFLFMALCREFWNMNFGNTKDKFIVWEHPT